MSGGQAREETQMNQLNDDVCTGLGCCREGRGRGECRCGGDVDVEQDVTGESTDKNL